MRKMQFGVRYHFRNPSQWAVPFPDLYEQALRQIETVEELGYDTVWVQEHHFTDDGYCPSPLLVLSNIAARTSRIRIATGILIMALHNPLQVAEDVAVLDILSGGRVDLGLGLGYKVEEYEAFGVPLTKRVRYLTESIELLRQAWSDNPVDFEGQIYSYHGMTVTPKPVQSEVPIWLAARALPAAKRAARLRCHINPSPVAEIGDAYLEELRATGANPADFHLVPNLFVYVTSDPKAAWSRLEPHYLYWIGQYEKWMTEAGDPPPDEIRDQWIIGDSDYVAEKISAMRARYPLTGVTVPSTLPGLDPDFMTPSLERFAVEVIPKLQAAEAGS